MFRGFDLESRLIVKVGFTTSIAMPCGEMEIWSTELVKFECRGIIHNQSWLSLALNRVVLSVTQALGRQSWLSLALNRVVLSATQALGRQSWLSLALNSVVLSATQALGRWLRYSHRQAQ